MKMVWPIALVFLFPPFLKLGNSDSASPGQAINYGPFRSVSHIVMVVHPLKPDEKWSGPTITEAGSNFGIVSYGTGCAVSKDGHVLTNSHVAREGETLMVGGWGDAAKSLSAEVLKRDTKNDLALLKVKPPSEPPWITTFSPSESLIEGREVFLWAYLQTPGYFVQFLRRGTVSMATPTPDGQHPIYIEVSASFGASGSPVFTQDSRNAIGIVSCTLLLPGGLPLPAGVLEVIPGERINKFLHDGGVHGY